MRPPASRQGGSSGLNAAIVPALGVLRRARGKICLERLVHVLYEVPVRIVRV